jgi:hypothetical protein
MEPLLAIRQTSALRYRVDLHGKPYGISLHHL